MEFEFKFLHMLQEIHNPVLDKFMLFITKLGDIGFIWLFISVVLIAISLCLEYKCKNGETNYKKYDGLKLKYMGLMIIIAIAIEVFTVNVCLKNLIDRQRPFMVDESIKLLITASGSSFPSGHTGASFAAAVSIFICNKKAGVAALVLASLIGFSRMYLFVHFPTDILGGIVVGSICAVVAKFIMDKFIYDKFLVKDKRKDHIDVWLNIYRSNKTKLYS